ncbi:MAG: hypothetical protein Kapaf2KO_14780 [Candidatus Kapaibacteriales bacterium]
MMHNTTTQQNDKRIKIALEQLSDVMQQYLQALDRLHNENQELYEQHSILEKKLKGTGDTSHELEKRLAAAELELTELNHSKSSLKAEVESLEAGANELIELKAEFEVESKERSRLAALSHTLEKENENLQKELDFARKEIARRNISKSSSDSETQQIKDKLAEANAQTYKLEEQLKSAKQTISELQEEKYTLNKQLAISEQNKRDAIEEADYILQEYKSAEEIREMALEEGKVSNQKYEELIERLATTEDTLQSYIQLTKDLEKDIEEKEQGIIETTKSLNHEVSQLKDELEEAESTNDRQKEDLAESEIKLKAANEEKENSRELLEQAESISADLKAANSELNKKKTIIGEKLDRANKLITEIEQQKKQELELAEHRLNGVKEQTEELVKAWKEEEDRYLSEIELLQNQNTHDQNELKEMGESLSKIRASYTDQLAEKENQLFDLTQTVAELKLSSASSEKLGAELDSARNSNATLREKIIELSQKIKVQEDLNLEKNKEQISLSDLRIESLEADLANLKIELDTKSQLISRIKDKTLKISETVKSEINRIDGLINN